MRTTHHRSPYRPILPPWLRWLLVLAIAGPVFLSDVASAQSVKTKLCDLLPASPAPANVAYNFCRNCGVTYASPAGRSELNVISIFYADSVEAARSTVDAEKKNYLTSRDFQNYYAGRPFCTELESPGLGEASYFIKDENPNFVHTHARNDGMAEVPVYHITFARGRYTVTTMCMAEFLDQLRAILAALDQTLMHAPEPVCNTAVTPPLPPPSTLGVLISCQTNNEAADVVLCSAQPTGQSPDASLNYAWTFDGARQAATGTDLRLSGVREGQHTVTVVVSDSVHQLTSAPATATFNKDAAQASGGSPGKRGGDDIPLIPILIIGTGITAGALGGAGWWLARKRKGRPSIPLVPLGNPPLVAPVPRRPPPPERFVPPPPPPPPPPAAPPPRPPEKVATPPVPPETPAQPRDNASPNPRDDSRKSELWIDVDLIRVRIRGDGKSEMVVTAQARRREGIAVVDAAAEVTPSWSVSDSSKVQLTQRAGFCTLAVRGTHAGNAPASVTITITGTSGRGPVNPATVSVVLEPVAIDVRIKVWKKGFLEQEVVATLPTVTRDVRCIVESRTVRDQLPVPVRLAHCTASIRVDGGQWSAPVEVRSQSDGTFWFGLPPRLIQSYGGTGSHKLKDPIALAFNEETLQAMTGYGEAFLSFSRDVRQSPSSEYGALSEELGNYREEFARQLRERDEDDHPRALSAIQLLKAAIVFTLKYRRDVAAQRRVVDYTAQEALSSVLDVLTDFLPIAQIVFKWVSRLGSKAISLSSGLLATLASKARSIPGGRFAARAMFYAVRVLRAPVDMIEKHVLELLDDARRFAADTGLSTRFIDAISRFGEDAKRDFAWPQPGSESIVPGELKEMARDAFDEALDMVAEISIRSLVGAMRLSLGILHIVGVLIAAAGKGIVTLLRNLPWDNESQWFKTVLEIVEYEVGNCVSSVYDGFGAAVDKLTLRHFSEPGTPGKDVSQKSLADMLLDQMVTVEDFDRICVPSLRLAYFAACNLNVTPEWQAAVSRVTRQECDVMNVQENREEWFYDAGLASDCIKLAVKVAQALALTWETAVVGLIRFGGWAASKVDFIPGVDSIVPFLTQTAAPAAEKLYQRLERFIDVCDAVAVRIPILMMEVVQLFVIKSMGPTRIDALFERKP